MLHTRFVIAVGAALLAAGCWPHPEHRSLKDPPPDAVRPALLAPKACDCAQRHRDHVAGQAPCGVTTLEEKEADDRRCGKLYHAPGHLKAPPEEPVI